MSSGLVEFWVELSLFWVCFCVWFPLGACSCSAALLSFGRLVCSVSFRFSFFVVFGLSYFCDGGRKPSFAYLELEIAMST